MPELHPEIVVDYPPNFKELSKRFAINPKAIYAWSPKIYNPAKRFVSTDLIEHEKVHITRQDAMGGPQFWWEKYLDDAEFRLDEEARAYGRQFSYSCTQNRDRNFQFRFLLGLANTLAGPMYGNITTTERAVELIKSMSK